MFGVGLLKGLGVTLGHFFGKTITQEYPEVKPNLPPRSHGLLLFYPEKCISCSLCVTACPNRAIVLKSEKGGEESKKRVLTEYVIDFRYCMFCGLCLDACPTSALEFSSFFETATYFPEEARQVFYRKQVAE